MTSSQCELKSGYFYFHRAPKEPLFDFDSYHFSTPTIETKLKMAKIRAKRISTRVILNCCGFYFPSSTFFVEHSHFHSLDRWDLAAGLA